VESELADERSFLHLYRTALRLRRDHPALGRGTLRWLDAGPELLCFAREPGFILAANLGPAPVPLPAHREILLASGPVTGGLPPGTAVWLSA
jgi:alpha-glucosidase